MEFILHKNGIVNLIQERKINASSELRHQWNRMRESYINKTETLKRIIELDILYLETSTEKNRKDKAIEKRKKEYDKHKKEYDDLSYALDTINKLNVKLENNDYKLHYIKILKRNSTYDYDLQAAYVFNDPKVFMGYYDRTGFNYGSL